MPIALWSGRESVSRLARRSIASPAAGPPISTIALAIALALVPIAGGIEQAASRSLARFNFFGRRHPVWVPRGRSDFCTLGGMKNLCLSHL